MSANAAKWFCVRVRGEDSNVSPGWKSSKYRCRMAMNPLWSVVAAAIAGAASFARCKEECFVSGAECGRAATARQKSCEHND
jgi:hypothetical protein